MAARLMGFNDVLCGDRVSGGDVSFSFSMDQGNGLVPSVCQSLSFYDLLIVEHILTNGIFAVVVEGALISNEVWVVVVEKFLIPTAG